jgi:hypothetical protein
MITIDTLNRELSPILGVHLEAQGQLPHPGSRYKHGEKGCGTWKDKKPFETNPNLRRLICYHLWRPGIVGRNEPPAAQRLLIRYDLKGKSAYQAVPEHGLSQIDSYHLNCGHEMTHAFACFGGQSGKLLFIIDLLLLPAMVLFLLAMLPTLSDEYPRVDFGSIAAIIFGLWLILAPSDKPKRSREKRGSIHSYSREEIVAEIGATLLCKEVGQINDWHLYSVKLIAHRLSTIAPKHRSIVLAEAFKDASLRKLKWTRKLQNRWCCRILDLCVFVLPQQRSSILGLMVWLS